MARGRYDSIGEHGRGQMGVVEGPQTCGWLGIVEGPQTSGWLGSGRCGGIGGRYAGQAVDPKNRLVFGP